MTCPKCAAEMRSYERNGIDLEQCTGCRGIFLDRGELERLIDAEGAYYQGRGRRRDENDDDDRHGGRGHGGRGHGFLGGLFGGGRH